MGTADEASVYSQYDSAGHLISSTDELGRVTQYQYDSAGRLIQQTDPDPDGSGPLSSPVTTYTYDAAGNLASQTDPLGRVTEYGYNDGQQTTTTRVNWDGANHNAVTSMAYDSDGNLASQTDPLGRVTRYGYDWLGRQTAVTQVDPGGWGYGYGYISSSGSGWPRVPAAARPFLTPLGPARPRRPPTTRSAA